MGDFQFEPSTGPFYDGVHPIIRMKDIKVLLDMINWRREKIKIVDNPSHFEAELSALYRISQAIEKLKDENKELRERISCLENGG